VAGEGRGAGWVKRLKRQLQTLWGQPLGGGSGDAHTVQAIANNAPPSGWISPVSQTSLKLSGNGGLYDAFHQRRPDRVAGGGRDIRMSVGSEGWVQG